MITYPRGWTIVINLMNSSRWFSTSPSWGMNDKTSVRIYLRSRFRYPTQNGHAFLKKQFRHCDLFCN